MIKSLLMYTRIVFLMGFLIFLSSCQENERDEMSVKLYYPTGELEAKVSMKDTLLHGLTTAYYKSGQKKSERYFTEGIPINHHYFYSKKGELITYEFYDILGNLRFRLIKDTSTGFYSQEGKSLHVAGAFKNNYTEGDTVELAPIIANPFKSKYNVVLVTEDKRIDRSYNFSDSISPLFIYTVNEGNNPIRIISEIYDHNNEAFRKDTVSLDLVGGAKH